MNREASRLFEMRVAATAGHLAYGIRSGSCHFPGHSDLPIFKSRTPGRSFANRRFLLPWREENVPILAPAAAGRVFHPDALATAASGCTDMNVEFMQRRVSTPGKEGRARRRSPAGSAAEAIGQH